MDFLRIHIQWYNYIHTSNCGPSRIKGKRAQKKTSRTDLSDGLEEKEASASEDVENRSDVSNAEPTISSGSDGHESGETLPFEVTRVFNHVENSTLQVYLAKFTITEILRKSCSFSVEPHQGLSTFTTNNNYDEEIFIIT